VQTRDPLSEWQIKSIHHLVLKNVDNKNAGAYRQENVLIAGATHRPPNFISIPSAMNTLMAWYENAGDLHAIERAARLHIDFVGIHPFVDRNGRTSRLLMNFELIRSGYLPVIIPVENRFNYYDALDTAHTTGDYNLFIELVALLEKQALQQYLDLILAN